MLVEARTQRYPDGSALALRLGDHVPDVTIDLAEVLFLARRQRNIFTAARIPHQHGAIEHEPEQRHQGHRPRYRSMTGDNRTRNYNHREQQSRHPAQEPEREEGSCQIRVRVLLCALGRDVGVQHDHHDHQQNHHRECDPCGRKRPPVHGSFRHGSS